MILRACFRRGFRVGLSCLSEWREDGREGRGISVKVLRGRYYNYRNIFSHYNGVELY
jgi:hypothetical protein